MCGIVGYVGFRQALPVLLQGLKRLEYRGYDSAGIVLAENGCLSVEKCVGKIVCLEEAIKGKEYNATSGIAHTRWATHGEPTIVNAHPHLDSKSQIALVHNGIIENYRALKTFLVERGHEFRTDTDTEILVHLIEEYYEGDLTEATRIALTQVEGTYGIVVIASQEPGKIVAARQGSPLVVGHGDNENFVASDMSAILAYTNRADYLKEGEIVTVTADKYEIAAVDKNLLRTPQIEEISWTLDQIEKGGYEHFMLKEIHEQPTTLANAIRGRLNYGEGIPRLNGLNLQYDELRKINRIIITACGTSWHSAMIGEYVIEEMSRVPVEIEYASEFRYRKPIIEPGTLVFVISQSGETADTLAALREAKKMDATVLGICNVVGSSIARETDGGVYIHAGPEIGVASTKAFTSQVMVLCQIALLLARMRHMTAQKGKELIGFLKNIPGQVEQILQIDDQICEIAEQYYNSNNFLYLGRGVNYPTALEGALKLKEISYIHAEGYPAAEMKHGPIALIDENMPAVVIALRDSVYDKVLSNIEEVKARQGRIIAIASEGDTEIAEKVNHVIHIPQTHPMFTPILASIPLQLLAYHIAVLRGCDIDQPRNLAKSVTVE